MSKVNDTQHLALPLISCKFMVTGNKRQQDLVVTKIYGKYLKYSLKRMMGVAIGTWNRLESTD